MQCSRCRAPLSPGSTACPNCGLAFASPVPAGVPYASGPGAVSAGAPGRRPLTWLWWVLGGLGLVVLVILGLAFVGYRSFQSRLTGGLGVREAAPGQQGSWTPSAAATAQLAPPFQVTGPLGYYTVQPPAGYTLRGTKMDAADGKSVIYTWTGPETPDGTAPQFALSFGSDGGVMSSQVSSAQDVAMGLRGGTMPTSSSRRCRAAWSMVWRSRAATGRASALARGGASTGLSTARSRRRT